MKKSILLLFAFCLGSLTVSAQTTETATYELSTKPKVKIKPPATETNRPPKITIKPPAKEPKPKVTIRPASDEKLIEARKNNAAMRILSGGEKKSWKITAMRRNGDLQDLSDCTRDNVLVFTLDGLLTKVRLFEKEDVCTGLPMIYSSDWKVTEAGTKLSLTDLPSATFKRINTFLAPEMEIIELTDQTLRFSFLYRMSEERRPITFEYTYQAE
ncbi:MAG: lipocalin family protein [Verrucomicrobia bacterium]|nr:lipocalin family protein [Cytophagales bacterium]